MVKPKRVPKSTKSEANVYASVVFLILAPLPVGMSIAMWVAPMAFFLLMIDGKSSGSMPSGYSTWMNRSSAGAKSNAPPQTRQPFVFFTTAFISFMERFTGQRDSTLSAVPAADVTARDDVLGIVNPAAATIGTTSSDVLSPGMPPMLCLSSIGVSPKSSVLPVSTMARARASLSLMFSPWISSAVRKAAISTSLRCLSTTSLTIVVMSCSRSLAPCSFARTCLRDSGS